MEKKFKYQEYLDKYKNCPSDKCIERDFDCFRWVHKEYTENDFVPQIFMNPPRKLAKEDITCEHYCLSVFKDLTSALERYRHICNSGKENFVEKFKTDVGEHTAKLQIFKDDGIADLPNNKTGHISFYPYVDCKILEKVKGIFDIFV